MKSFLTALLVLSVLMVFAQEPVRLNDFATNGASTFRYDPEIEGITTDNQFFFIADDGKAGEELWRSNGTAVGTQFLKDIRHGEETSSIQFLAAIGNTVYFAANDGEHGFELWTTQGTTTSTQMLKDLNPGDGSSSPSASAYATFNDLLYFAASGDKGRELYRSDGTEAGTTLVKDINPTLSPNSGNPYSSSPSKFIATQNALYFTANDGEYGTELWRTDGAAGGTTMVKDITEGPGSTNFSQFKAVNNTLCFVANDGEHGNELWLSLGSDAFTYMVKDITEGEESSTIEILEVVNDILYFTVRESVFRRLWKTDGTEEGTVQVLNANGSAITVRGSVLYNDQLILNAGGLWVADGDTIKNITSGISTEGEFAIMNDTLYFIGYEGIEGNGLWKTDGTAEGTVPVKENITSASYREIDHLVTVGNHVFFIAEVDEFGRELWSSDGTEEGSFMLIDSAPGEEDGFRSYEDVTFYPLDDKLLFPGFDEAHGRELWVSDGTVEGTALLKDIVTKSEDIRLVSTPVAYADHTFFATDAGVWKTDGSAENTALLKEIMYVSGLNVFNEKLMFSASAPGINRTIWISDGTKEGTQPLLDSAVARELLFLFRDNQPQTQDHLLFTGRDTDHGWELWTSDGTKEGTMMVKDINEGTDDALYSLDNTIVTDDLVFFVANDGILGNELWKTDGTEAGTVPVSDINPFGSSSPRNFTEIDGTLFFSADDGTGGHELWKTDGTTGGTSLVKDIFPGDENDDGVSSTPFINFQGTLFFGGNDGEHGAELWKSDGTEEGTVMVKNIYPENGNFSRSSSPTNFYVDGNAFYFVAQDSTGRKIWKSDGTEAGTQPFLKLEAVYNTQLFGANGTIFFSAIDDENGQELWRMNNLPEVITQVYDIIPGSRGSSPLIYGFHNDVLYFQAEDDVSGKELWTLTPLKAEVQLEANRTAICTSGDSITFSLVATNAGTNPKYVWYINDQVVDDQTGTIFTTVGLSDGDEVKVQVIADEEVWVLQDSIFSETIAINFSSLNPKITIAGNKLTASEGLGYQWYFEGEPLPDTTQNHVASTSGSYQVEITNEHGCSFFSDEVEVIVCTIEKPTIQLQDFTLTSSEAASYQWLLNGEPLPDTTQAINAQESGNYQVEVTNEQGCTAVSDIVAIDLCSNFTATLTQDGTTLTASEGASYKWLLNGETIPNNTQSIETEESGSYQVEITDSLGCVALSEVIEITVTGIEDEILARQLNMYPNPVASQLHVDVQTHEEVGILIYDTSGKQVYANWLFPQSDNHEIPLHHLTPGIYLVRFIGEKGVHQKKLIKQ